MINKDRSPAPRNLLLLRAWCHLIEADDLLGPLSLNAIVRKLSGMALNVFASICQGFPCCQPAA
jgi:hypothetical protein